MIKYKEIKIDNNVPIPCDYKPTKRKCKQKNISRKYPFYKMEIGDSILVKQRDPVTVKKIAHDWKKGLYAPKGWNFCVRAEGSGTRLWRTK